MGPFNARDMVVVTNLMTVAATTTGTVLRAPSWSSVVKYVANDIVTWAGLTWKSLQHQSLNLQPDITPTAWSSLALQEKWFLLSLTAQSVGAVSSIIVGSLAGTTPTAVSPTLVVPANTNPPLVLPLNLYGWYKALLYGDGCQITAGAVDVQVALTLGYHQRGG